MSNNVWFILFFLNGFLTREDVAVFCVFAKQNGRGGERLRSWAQVLCKQSPDPEPDLSGGATCWRGGTTEEMQVQETPFW